MIFMVRGREIAGPEIAESTEFTTESRRLTKTHGGAADGRLRRHGCV